MSKIISKEEAQNRIDKIHGYKNIIITEYKSTAKKAKFQCSKCNFIWETTPRSIYYLKSGCPQCKGGVKRTHEEFRALFGKGSKFEVQNVSCAADIVSKLDEWYSGSSNELQGLDTGFEQLDKITNGLKQQDLVIVSGDSGIGKTTLAESIANSLNHI